MDIAGDKAKFEPLVISFIIDENYLTWLSVYDWIVGLTFPEDFAQYRNLPYLNKSSLPTSAGKTFPQYSDATLTINTNKNNPNIKFKFVNAFPYSLSSVDLTYTQGPEEVLVAHAAFAYNYFTRA
jgi:hypothetical protein